MSVRQCGGTVGFKYHANIHTLHWVVFVRPPTTLQNSREKTKPTPAPMNVGLFPTKDRKPRPKRRYASLLRAHRIPESLRAFWRMVSLTAAKTSLIFDVSVAWVRLCWLALAVTARESNILGI